MHPFKEGWPFNHLHMFYFYIYFLCNRGIWGERVGTVGSCYFPVSERNNVWKWVRSLEMSRLNSSVRTTLPAHCVPRCFIYRTSTFGCMLLFIPPTEQMAGLCAVALASGGVVFSLVLLRSALPVSLHLFVFLFLLWRKMGRWNSCILLRGVL